MKPGRILVAGLFYFLLAFGFGFLMGAVRILVLLPRVGDVVAVLIELPVMIAISATAAAVICRRFAIWKSHDCLAMGGIAFVALQAAEAFTATVVLRVPIDLYFATMASPSGLIGLGGQGVFALLPLVVARAPA